MKRLSTMIFTLALIRCANAATVTFSDGTFLDAQWPTATIADTLVGGGTLNATQILAGGNPDAYRQVGMPGTVSGAMVFLVAHMFVPATWNPSIQGAINSLDWSYDITATDTGKGTSASPEFASLLLQNGIYYLATTSITGTLSTLWMPWNQSGLTADYFVPILAGGSLGYSHPDFSAAGGLIKFGFISIADFSTSSGGIDNWQVVVNFTDAPEPSSMWLVGGVLAVVVAWRFRREP